MSLYYIRDTWQYTSSNALFSAFERCFSRVRTGCGGRMPPGTGRPVPEGWQAGVPFHHAALPGYIARPQPAFRYGWHGRCR